MKRFMLFVQLIFLCNEIAFAQLDYAGRIEFDLKDGFEEEEILEFNDRGFIIHAINSESINKFQIWRLHLVDKDMKLVKTQEIKLDKRLKLRESYNDDKALYAMYVDSKGNFELISVDAGTLEYHKVNGTLPKKTLTKDFRMVGERAFFRGEAKGRKFLFSIDCKSGSYKVLNHQFTDVWPKNMDILSIQAMENPDELFAYVEIRSGKKHSELYAMRYNLEGEHLETIHLSADVEENLVSASASKIGGSIYVFTGNYSSKFATGVSEGLYFCLVSGGKVSGIQFYNYFDLNEFTRFMSGSKKERLEKKHERMKSKGKELKKNFYLATHEVVSQDDGYLLLGEAYFPVYQTQTFGTGTGAATTTIVFVGNEYTHAMLAKFDKLGNLQWDNSFELSPESRPYDIKHFVDMAIESDGITLMYSSSSKIEYKTVDFDGQVIRDFTSEEIETGDDQEETAKTKADVTHWYGNHFLAYGSQKVKSKNANNGDKRRKVFFVNKVSVQ